MSYKQKIEKLINELSDYGFFEFKTWLSYNFADVTEGFSKDIRYEDETEEYLNELKEYIEYLQKAYDIKSSILKSNRESLILLFDFDDIEVQKIIDESLESTFEYLNDIFINSDEEDIKRDLELLSYNL